MNAANLNEDGLLVSAPDSIYTFSGRFIRPLDPDPEDIFISDIAHALGNQCRWTGHVSSFYSVAEHSVHVAACVPQKLRLTALLHDASEAYLTDLARPIKKAPGLGELYHEAEARLEAAIAARFDIEDGPLSHSPIKQADEWMLWREAQCLLPGLVLPQAPEGCPMPQCWSPRMATEMFHEAFREYGGRYTYGS